MASGVLSGHPVGALPRIVMRTVIEMTLLSNNPLREPDEESALDGRVGTTDPARAGARAARNGEGSLAPSVATQPTESESDDPAGTAIAGPEASPR